MNSFILFLKKIVAFFLINDFVGICIRKVFQPILIVNGVKVDISNKLISNKNVAYMFWGAYESAEYRLIKKHLIKSIPIVELGGSIGVVTSQCVKNNPVKIFSVEANSDLLPLQYRNLMLNNATDFHQVNAGIGYNLTKNYFLEGESNVSGKMVNNWEEGAVEVEFCTLATLIQRFLIDQYILVCDIEGMEYDLFLNEPNAFKNCIQVFVEMHSTDMLGNIVNKDYYISKILDLGFVLVERDGNCFCFGREG